MNNEEELAEVKGIITLLRDGQFSLGEIATACACIMCQEQTDVRKNAVEQAVQIIRNYRGNIDLTALAQSIIVKLELFFFIKKGS